MRCINRSQSNRRSKRGASLAARACMTAYGEAQDAARAERDADASATAPKKTMRGIPRRMRAPRRSAPARFRPCRSNAAWPRTVDRR
ncbi:hypothetical protein [Burkholderia pseudomallei]|uniref:hypothetical protein n=1 Tax=Burkholderia pseudomallei TaxID=28450 RepID=UPI0009B24CB9|nr:hypothetical protein [Burkholderia pseudomallei]